MRAVRENCACMTLLKELLDRLGLVENELVHAVTEAAPGRDSSR